MTSKSGKIASILTKAILDHRLKLGEKLGERELSEILGASRIVVRQALIELSETGLVSLQRNRGAFVAKPDLQEALEIFDALTMLEQCVAENLAAHASRAAVSELRILVQKQREAADSRNDELAAQIGRQFHRELIKQSHNKVVEEVHTQLSQRAALLSSLYKRTHNACALVNDHETMLELVEKGEAGEVKRLLQTHNHLIARSHHFEDVATASLDRAEALKPYIDVEDPVR